MNANYPLYDANHHFINYSYQVPKRICSLHPNPTLASPNRIMDWTMVNHNYAKPSNVAVKNLQIQMNEIHLSYISRDDCILKTKSRERLELLIKEYLFLIPHIRKFTFIQIWDCLDMTVLKTDQDFDPEKSILAFDALERYALNLLNYPWRHEYYRIFAFSGFFHRYVRNTLVGYEKILELMGYSYDCSLDVYHLVEIPIDPDKMIQISLDCLVAIVEIRIMMEIKCKCQTMMNWKDIFSIRSEYICNTQTAIQLYCDLKRNNKLIELDLPDYSVKKFDYKLENFLTSPVNSNHHRSNNDNVADSLNLIDNREILIPPPSNYLESDLDSIDFIDSGTTEQIPSKNYDKPMNECTVTKRIDLQNDETSINNDHLSINNNSRKMIIIKNLDPLLVTKIYYGKEKENRLNAEEQNSKISANSSLKMGNNEVDTRSSLVSPLNEMKNLEKLNHKQSPQPKLQNDRIWNCAACTYANDEHMEICEMCHKSRRKGNESKPLATGGRECNQCTLVNDKNEQFCGACNTSLINSPTYI